MTDLFTKIEHFYFNQKCNIWQNLLYVVTKNMRLLLVFITNYLLSLKYKNLPEGEPEWECSVL